MVLCSTLNDSALLRPKHDILVCSTSFSKAEIALPAWAGAMSSTNSSCKAHWGPQAEGARGVQNICWIWIHLHPPTRSSTVYVCPGFSGLVGFGFLWVLVWFFFLLWHLLLVFVFSLPLNHSFPLPSLLQSQELSSVSAFLAQVPPHYFHHVWLFFIFVICVFYNSAIVLG